MLQTGITGNYVVTSGYFTASLFLAVESGLCKELRNAKLRLPLSEEVFLALCRLNYLSGDKYASSSHLLTFSPLHFVVCRLES